MVAYIALFFQMCHVLSLTMLSLFSSPKCFEIDNLLIIPTLCFINWEMCVCLYEFISTFFFSLISKTVGFFQFVRWNLKFILLTISHRVWSWKLGDMILWWKSSECVSLTVLISLLLKHSLALSPWASTFKLSASQFLFLYFGEIKVTTSEN